MKSIKKNIKKRRMWNCFLSTCLSLGLSSGCSRIPNNFWEGMPEKPRMVNPYHEIFRPDNETNKRLSLGKSPSDIRVDYEQYDEQNKTKIVNERAYPIDSPAPKSPLEEIVNVSPMNLKKIPLINATYIEYQRNIEEEIKIEKEDDKRKDIEEETSSTLKRAGRNIERKTETEKRTRIIDEILLDYKCRIPPAELKKIIEPFIPQGIEIFDFSQGNMLIFRGEKERFGDFSYFCSILNNYDIIPEQMRLKIAILNFFKDNTYDREGVLDIRDKKGNVILKLNLPSSHTGEPLQFGVGFDPFYGIRKGNYGFDGFIRFLDSNGYAEILTEIDIMLNNGKPTSMKNVDLIPYFKAVLSKEALIETLEYMETGPVLEATAFYNEEGFINLLIKNAKYGELTGYVGTIQRPTFRNADINGEYVLQNGKTHVAMRAISSKYKSVRRGFPFLNKIPVIKDISGALSYERNESNLIYLVEARRIQRGDLTGILQR